MRCLQILLEQANQSLGRLDGINQVLPDPRLFLYFYVRKEAVLSSQIEGTQSTISDLLLFEIDEVPGVPISDVQEVSSYVRALTYGLQRLKDLPLSLRLIKEIHGILLSTGRGAEKMPGEFRTSQNWIQGTRPGNALYVPPPPEQLPLHLGNLETFLHADHGLPILIRAGIAHVQFESIHPFLDGNGRLGRLLITFLLCAHGVLQEPLLYLSLFFKEHKQEYYDHLMEVRKTGDWEAWLEFFLQGIKTTSDQAVSTAKNILNLFKQDQSAVDALKTNKVSSMKLYKYLQQHPMLSIPRFAKASAMNYPSASSAVNTLLELGTIRETTGKPRNRIFVYTEYLKILNEGTVPLRRT